MTEGSSQKAAADGRPLRRGKGAEAAPVRHVHLGLGNFFRAHQACSPRHHGVLRRRITPRATQADQEAVLAATGYEDRCPVVTETFAEWVLEDRFPAGRPAWDQAGARFVTDVAPHEERKLWLLNGSHSLLAYAGGLLGHRTVAEAIHDPLCRAWVEQWCDEAGAH